MNRASLLFVGIFFTLAFSFTTLLLTNNLGYGGLKPHFDEGENKAFPLGYSGVAQRGHMVYQDLGCVSCHTQQVRRPGFGSDTARGWGERQSVAREYIRDGRVLLGDQRIGPDLRTIGLRAEKEQKTAEWFYHYLYDPQAVTLGTMQPAYRFLFEIRPVLGQAFPKALTFPGVAVPAKHELVPTERAEALVAYLLSLNDTYAYPENVYTAPEPKAGEGKKEGAHP